jgi:hypothetical protein
VENLISQSQPSVLVSDGFLTYPHLNGFYAGGTRLIACRWNGELWSLFSLEIESGRETEVYRIDRRGDQEAGGNITPMWDVAFEAGVLVFKQQNALWLLDLQRGGEPELLYRPAAGASVNLLASITRDGKRVIFEQVEGDWHSGHSIDVETGEVTTLVRENRWLDHFQPCPHDENWILYCHQTWGKPEYPIIGCPAYFYHPQLAPEGKRAFEVQDQSQGAARLVHTTHDRWAFHETCYVTIVYPNSPGGPHGLWQVWPDERAPRLVSYGAHDWHCDISRDGKWAVVDSQGLYNWDESVIDDLRGNSDIILIEMATGKRQFLARTQWGGPQHPHPIFTPDGSAVLFHRSETTPNGLPQSEVLRAPIR